MIFVACFCYCLIKLFFRPNTVYCFVLGEKGGNLPKNTDCYIFQLFLKVAEHSSSAYA